jgi:hypothetical protein
MVRLLGVFHARFLTAAVELIVATGTESPETVAILLPAPGDRPKPVRTMTLEVRFGDDTPLDRIRPRELATRAVFNADVMSAHGRMRVAGKFGRDLRHKRWLAG